MGCPRPPMGVAPEWGPRRSDGGAERVPDVRPEHDDQDDDHADDRDRQHRVLKHPGVRLILGELDLPVSVAVADHADSPLPRPSLNASATSSLCSKTIQAIRMT